VVSTSSEAEPCSRWEPRGGGGGLSFVVGSSAVTLREFDPYLFECVCYEDNQGVPNYHPNIW
jgi:hypothetical protein